MVLRPEHGVVALLALHCGGTILWLALVCATHAGRRCRSRCQRCRWKRRLNGALLVTLSRHSLAACPPESNRVTRAHLPKRDLGTTSYTNTLLAVMQPMRMATRLRRIRLEGICARRPSTEHSICRDG